VAPGSPPARGRADWLTLSVAMTFATSQCSAARNLCCGTFAVCENSRVRRHCFLVLRRIDFRQSALNLAVDVGHHRGIFVRRRRHSIGDAGAGRAGGAAAGAPARRPPAGPPRLHEGRNPPRERVAEFVDVGGHRIVLVVVAAAVAPARRLSFFALCGHGRLRVQFNSASPPRRLFFTLPCRGRVGAQRRGGAVPQAPRPLRERPPPGRLRRPTSPLQGEVKRRRRSPISSSWSPTPKPRMAARPSSPATSA